MTTRVLVTGALGQLGTELIDLAGPEFECVAVDIDELDITDLSALQAAFSEIQPQLVINAAAYTAVDKAEAEPDIASGVNAKAPAHLGKLCAAHGIRLIHISTDFIFDGRASTPYLPTSVAAPVNEYGRGKLAGEEAVRAAVPDALIIRTAWVYSRHGNNFVKTMLRLMNERSELTVVADQVGSPTWARGLAQACWAAADKPDLAGTYHWTDAGVCSWYDFAVAIYEEGRGLGLLDNAVEIRPVSTADYPTPAQRPAYSVLDKSDTWRDFELEAVHWRQQLRGMLQDLRNCEDA